MENKNLKVVAEDQVVGNYLIVVGEDVNDMKLVKMEWNGIRLTGDEAMRLAHGEEVGIRTDRCSVTYGHIGLEAVSEAGSELFEFTPDFKLDNSDDYFRPMITFESGFSFKNDVAGMGLSIERLLELMKKGEITVTRRDGVTLRITIDEGTDSNGEHRLKAVETGD